MKYAKNRKTGELFLCTPGREANKEEWEVVTVEPKAPKVPAAPKTSNTRKAKAVAPAAEGDVTDPGSVVDDLADQ